MRLKARKLEPKYCVRVGMQHRRSSEPRERLDAAISSGQWRAMPDGIDGIHGIPGNVVSVTYRF